MSNRGEEAQNPRHACAACKHQRRKCDNNCVFAPFFPATRADNFVLVHKVFGVKNMRGILRNLSHEKRKRAVASLEWEAKAWKDDEVDGPLGLFNKIEKELEELRKQQQNNSTVVSYSNYQPNSGLIGINHNAAALPAFVPNSNFNTTNFGYDNNNPNFGIPYNTYAGLPPIGTSSIENQGLLNNSVLNLYYPQVKQRSFVIRERGDYVVQPSTPMQQRNQVMAGSSSPILMSPTNSFTQPNYQQGGSQPSFHGYLQGPASQSQRRGLQ